MNKFIPQMILVDETYISFIMRVQFGYIFSQDTINDEIFKSHKVQFKQDKLLTDIFVKGVK